MGDMPPCWTTYFMVDDCDATAKTVKAEGGAVFVEPRDIPDVGRFAVVADPQGAMFAVITMAEGHETSPS
jgi:predicted enzyme related to lactoylglutathione lyase